MSTTTNLIISAGMALMSYCAAAPLHDTETDLQETDVQVLKLRIEVARLDNELNKLRLSQLQLLLCDEAISNSFNNCNCTAFSSAGQYSNYGADGTQPAERAGLAARVPE